MVACFVFLTSEMNSGQNCSLENMFYVLIAWNLIFCYFGSQTVLKPRTLSFKEYSLLDFSLNCDVPHEKICTSNVNQKVNQENMFPVKKC